MAEEAQLDWSGAQVSDGTLSVKLTGDFDDEWAQTFARTLALLSSSGTWGSVEFKKRKLTVEGVAEGSEDNVRFALDGAVQEANAHHADDDADDDDSDESSAEDDGPEGDETDRRMTDRFRDPSD
ncbi:MAG TPA: hypothetical protein VHW04_03275 [Solirubrobacteraceae bacterium]|nr:hypothetical protein [Solirubrobacteraceae bacterium]